MAAGTETGSDDTRISRLAPEPSRLTLADLCVIVAGFAVAFAIPQRVSLFPYLVSSGKSPVVYLAPGAMILLLRILPSLGIVLTVAVAYRKARYGGLVRPAELVAFTFAASCLLDAIPNLDEGVNAYYQARVGPVLDFGLARWLVSAPAWLGIGVLIAALLWLYPRTLAGSRPCALGTVVVILAGLILWFWGPIAVTQLELPWLLIPSPAGDPRTWGWLGTVVDVLRFTVRYGPWLLTWCLPFAAVARSWLAWRRSARKKPVWTERACVLLAMAALPTAVAAVAAGGTSSFGGAIAVAGAFLLAWSITGKVGVGPTPAPAANARES